MQKQSRRGVVHLVCSPDWLPNLCSRHVWLAHRLSNHDCLLICEKKEAGTSHVKSALEAGLAGGTVSVVLRKLRLLKPDDSFEHRDSRIKGVK